MKYTLLGPHSDQQGSVTQDWLTLEPRLAKAMDSNLGSLRTASPNTLTLGRLDDDGLIEGQGGDPNRWKDQGKSPAYIAGLYFDLLLPKIRANPHLRAMEGVNEPVLRSRDGQENGYRDNQGVWHDPVAGVKEQMDEDRRTTMEWYAEFSYLLAERLANEHIQFGCGSWASGLPRIEHDVWKYWGRALQASQDFGALQCYHDYGAGKSLSVLRPLYNQLEWSKLGYSNVTHAITELGINQSGGGWRKQYATWEECFSGSVRPYLDALHQLPFRVYAVWFDDIAQGHGWDGFSVASTNIVQTLRDYISPSEVIQVDKQTAITTLTSVQGEIQAVLDWLNQTPLNWWETYPNGPLAPSRKSTNLNLKLDFYHLPTDSTPYSTRQYTATGTANIDVFERSGDRFRVTQTPQSAIWVTAEQLKQF